MRVPIPEAVLDAATRLIEQGNESSSIRALADEAAVPASSIYEHFESKEHVFAAALGREAERGALDPRRLDRARGLDGAMREVVAQRIAHARARPRFVVLAAQKTLDRAGDRELRRTFAADVATLAARIERETIAFASPREAAVVALAALDGLVLAAVEERPQYLDDPAFALETSGVLAASIGSAPGPLPCTRARSNESREWRAATNDGLRRAPRQERARTLVDAILRGAERVIDRRGTEEATTPSIAEAAGVSVGSLYQYFRDRDSVLRSVIDWWIAHDLERMRATMARRDGTPFAALYEQGLIESYEPTLRHLGVYRAMFSLLPRLGRYAAAQEFLARGMREAAAYVAKRPEAEAIDPELTTFVTGHALVAWMRRLITTEPALYASPAFRDALVRVGRAVTSRAPS